MEQLDLFIEQFYALPQVASVVNSSGILRLAVLQYGKPLFLITCAFIILLLILLVTRLKPKKGRPKKIKEPKAKPVKAAKPAKRQKKPRGTPKSVMKNLAKIPDSPLPLYPVADKRKPLAMDDPSAPAVVMPVVDDSSLIAGLDTPEPAIAAPKPVMSSQPVQSFTLDSSTAAALTGTSPAPAKDDDFTMPLTPDVSGGGQFNDHDTINDHDAPDGDDHDDSDLNINSNFSTGFNEPSFDDPFDTNKDDHEFNGSNFNNDINNDDINNDDDFEQSAFDETTDINDRLDVESDFNSTPSPKHEVRVDVSPIGGDDFEMPVGSFGSDDENPDGLSPSAQQKLAELNDRNNS